MTGKVFHRCDGLLHLYEYKEMPSPLHFEYISLVEAPPEAVFRFHERNEAIELLRPPWQPMQVLRQSGGLEAGAEVEFRIWMGPIPVVWLAKHVECQRPTHFTDIQLRGPFQSWRHEHRFERHGEATQLIDRIEFSLPAAPLTHRLFAWAIKLQLWAMFRHRHRATKQHCEQPRKSR